MKTHLVDAFDRRVSRLEREVRWWRWGGLTILIGTVLFAVGQGSTFATDRIVEAEQFVVKDAEGKARARLGVGSDNSTSLIFYDHTGAWRAWLGARHEKDNGLPLLWFSDDAGRIQIAVGYHLEPDPIEGPKYVGPT